MSPVSATAPAGTNATPAASGVWITGLGAVTCAGCGVEDLWTAASEPQIFAQWLEPSSGGTRYAVCRAVEPVVHGMRAADYARLDRFAQLGVAAGQQAWDDAGLSESEIDPRRVAVISGTSRGPVSARRGALDVRRRPRPTDAVYSSSSSLTGTLAGLVGARGPSLSVSATCASSAVALGVAAMQITSGMCDVAIVGGADAPLHPEFLAELQATGVLGSGSDPAAVCRPYECDRRGITIGEAAAYLVLESPRHAQTRGADGRAELVGWSSTCDAGRRSGMSDDARGVREAMEWALACASLVADDVDAVHVHGTGTQVGDLAEGRALRGVFGPRADVIPFTSTKPVTGHCLGASGALQAVLNVRCLEEQCIPATCGGEQADPDCGVLLHRGTPWRGELATILTHSAGFWGNHAGLVMRRL